MKACSAAQRTMEALARHEEERRERLNEKERELFAEYDDAWGEILKESCLDSFVIGFRLGARFAVDMFVCEDAPFEGGDE